MLLDSNIIIYSFQNRYAMLQNFVEHKNACCSAISRVETLGFHALSKDEAFYLEACFQTITVFPVDHAVILKAVELRQKRKMTLGDAIIAATALEYRQDLVTRNEKDFDWIPGIKVIDPFELS